MSGLMGDERTGTIGTTVTRSAEGAPGGGGDAQAKRGSEPR